MSSNPTTANPALATPRSEQPASEWASSTLSALDPATTSHPSELDSQSVVSTPGLDVPGAFPGSHPKKAVVEQDMQKARETAWSALEAAKGYAQTAAETAGGYAQTAAETAGGYLPASVSAYLPGSTSPNPSKSLPSHETSQNEHPSSIGGVGTLPGPPGEIGVAVLPDERTGGQSVSAGSTSGSHISNNTLPSQETSQNEHPSSTTGVGALPGPPGELGVAVLPDERTDGQSVDKAVADSQERSNLTKSSPITTTTNNNPVHPPSSSTGIPETGIGKPSNDELSKHLPSHDDKSSGVLGKSAGVGALPGSTSESSVALLPEERVKDAERGQSFASTADGASTDASTRSLGSHMNLPPSAPHGSSKAKPDLPHHPEEVKGSQVGQVHLNDSPRVDGREHALAMHEDKKFTDSNMKKDSIDTDLPGPAAGHTPVTSPALTGKHTTASSVATPGHDGYPPQVPEKDHAEHTDPLDHDHAADSHRASTSSSGQESNNSSIRKKPGFMDKLKGEAKILSGKLGGKEEKVEEGKKLLGRN